MLRWSVAGKIASDLLGNPAGRASNPCSWVGSVAGVQQRRTRHCVPATGTMTDASKARVGRRLKDLARGPQADRSPGCGRPTRNCRACRCSRGLAEVHTASPARRNGSVGRVVKLVGTRGGFQKGRTCGTGARLVFRYPSASSRAPPVVPFVQRHRGPPR